MRVFVRDLRCGIERKIGVTHLRQRIQLGMSVVFPSDLCEIRFGCAVFLDVNLRDAPEQFREHEIAILGLFIVIIGSRAEHIGAIERRHRLLLFRSDHENNIVKSTDDPFRAKQYRESAGCAGCFGVHRRNATQFRIDLRNKRAELQLFGKLARVEIANCTGLNLRRINLCIIDRLLAGLNNDVPDGFAFLF